MNMPSRPRGPGPSELVTKDRQRAAGDRLAGEDNGPDCTGAMRAGLDANYWRVRRLADLIEILGFKDRALNKRSRAVQQSPVRFRRSRAPSFRQHT